MKNVFFKFPGTPHLTAPGSLEIRNDKVMSEAERKDFLQQELVVEEKMDGANLGISFDSEGNVCVQNRGNYLPLPGIGQWKKLEEWLSKRIDDLFEILTDQYILFGEWCYAQHSVFYNRLPDWFLGFDVFDRQTEKFFAAGRRDGLLKTKRLSSVPIIARGKFTIDEIRKLVPKSNFGDWLVEGLYLRSETTDFLVKRAKLVRPDFIQAIGPHWSASGIKPNQLK